MSLKLKLADNALKEAGRLDQALKELQAQAEAEMEAIRQKWEEVLAPMREQRSALDRTILTLCKLARQEFFAEADLLDLPHGFLLYSKRQVVKKRREVLALLESLAWEEAIRRTAAVRWEVIETWPEARLIACGTERVDRETFAYEIKAPGKSTGICSDEARRQLRVDYNDLER